MNDPKVDAASLLANLKNKSDSEVPTEKVAPVSPVLSNPNPATSVPEYQVYNSSRISTCLFTTSGKRINFSNYQYYTKDTEIIAYLDREIKDGLTGFTKGKMLSAEDLNPEAAKKREIIEEFKASQEGREFGNTKRVEERTNALSTDGVAN
jgi:hypothetical protein